jgi:CTP:molybdopterin cytidylyltransferase MocA
MLILPATTSSSRARSQSNRGQTPAWRPGRIAIASYDGRTGHPVAMDPALWDQALHLADADEGARRLLAARADLVDKAPCSGDLIFACWIWSAYCGRRS